MLEATLLWESALQNAPVRYGSQRHFIFKLHIKLLKAAFMCVSNGEQWFVNIYYWIHTKEGAGESTLWHNT